jgi:hypothetical protein
MMTDFSFLFLIAYHEKLFSLKDKVAVVIGGTGELCDAMAVSPQ